MSTFLKSKQLYEAIMLVYQRERQYLEENKEQMTSDSSYALASISKLWNGAPSQ